MSPTLVAEDTHNDLALLSAPGVSGAAATFRGERTVALGAPVVVAGYPLRGVLTEGLQVTPGAVSALAGPRDDARFLQITAPVQVGNSGGPLLDAEANVVGVVVGKLDALRVAEVTGDIPQNINFSIKGSVARAFLDIYGVDYMVGTPQQKLDVPEVAARARAFTVIVECWK